MTDKPQHAGPDIRSRVVHGLAWVAGAQVAMHVTRAVVAVIIARLLTPDEYGLAALAIVFASLVMVFSDLALGAALIQRKTLTEKDKNTAFWITLGSGVAFTVLGVLLSGPIASLYGEPDAKPLLVALSASFFVTAAGATQLTLMMRVMDFRRSELLVLGGSVGGAVCAVVLAARGAGAWALVMQQVAATTLTTALVWWRSEWYPRFMFSRASLRDLGGFSAYMLGQRILYYLQVNGDRFLIGRYLGTTALGTYAVAYNTMLVPASKIGGPLQRVFSPAFSRIQDDPERIAAAWARVVRVIGLAAIPSLGGLVVVAPDFVPVVLGSQWKDAVPVVQILAWVGIIQAVQGLNYDVLLARGRARTMFRFSIVLTTCHLAAFGVGLHWGVIGVAVGYAISTTLVEPIQTLLAARCLGVSPMVFVRALSGVVQATLGMCGVALAVRIGLENGGVDQAVRLLACTGVGVLVFVPLCLWRVPELAGEARALLRRGQSQAPRVGGAPVTAEQT